MNRTRVANVVAGLLVAVIFAVIWLLVYEVVCGFRWTPGEGATKWALVLRQFSFRTWSSITPEFFWLGPSHFWSRVVYLPTRTEALARAVISFAVVVGAGVALAIAHFTTRPSTMHGDARFGTIAEAERGRLMQAKGLLLGAINGRTLRSDDPAHVVVVGPTRSGKGVSFVIPNGLTWAGSMVVLDIKLENFGAFGKARFERGDKVFVFAPGSAKSHRYNPLDFVRRGPEMATDCANVAGFLVATSAESEWSMAARKFVAALLGYVLTSELYEDRRYIRSAVKLISTGQDIAELLKSIAAAEQGRRVPQWVFDEFNQLVAIPDRTRASVMFNVNNAFAAWSSDLVSAVTETSDFDIRKLRTERMSIFIGSPLADLESYRPLVRILFQQIHDVLMRELPGPKEPHGVLLLLDEFFALGKMTSLASKIAVSAGYGFRMAIILQNISQLDEIYGQATRETMISGAAIKLFVAINDNVTAKYVSESLGSRTARSSTRVRGRGFSQAERVTMSEMGVPLRRPQELSRMPANKSILLLANSRPFEVSKIFYYKVGALKKLMARATTTVLIPPLRRWSDRGASQPSALEPVSAPLSPATAQEAAKATGEAAKPAQAATEDNDGAKNAAPRGAPALTGERRESAERAALAAAPVAPVESSDAAAIAAGLDKPTAKVRPMAKSKGRSKATPVLNPAQAAIDDPKPTPAGPQPASSGEGPGESLLNLPKRTRTALTVAAPDEIALAKAGIQDIPALIPKMNAELAEDFSSSIAVVEKILDGLAPEETAKVTAALAKHKALGKQALGNLT